MGNWFKARWRAYLESADPDEALTVSGPFGTVVAAGTLILLLLCLAYVPPLARLSELRHVWVSVALVLCGALLTHVAWRHRCRGTIGSLATLLDNTFYSTALAWAAMNAQLNVGIALAIAHGMMLVAFPGQLYSFSFLLVVSMTLPLAVLLIALQPALPVALILVCSTVLMLVFSEVTRSRRGALHRQTRLQQALGAADRIADESVQAALTTTLLTLGHLLHELRNYQTAISVNLGFIGLEAELSEAAARALEEAQDAQRRQEALLRDTIADLRSRSTQVRLSFSLTEALESAAKENRSIAVSVRSEVTGFEVVGNPEHLRVVLLNLIRNAEQAGASTVQLDARLEESGSSVELTVHDNGKGIPEESRSRLFDSFAISNKPGGSGLGLYLVRRYVELLGGRVQAKEGPLGGAAFVIRLPGRSARDTSRWPISSSSRPPKA